MRQLNNSISGSKLLSDSFLSEIVPLKRNFQTAVKNEEFAQQLTMMTFKAFERVQKREFIDQAWKCKDRLELAGNLCQLIDHFNDLSRWVQVTILQSDGVKKRGRMIKKFIKIMDCLLKYNNLQSLCAVYCALSSPAIVSLECAWKYIASKHMERYQEIKGYFHDKMINLRNLHRERKAPLVPYTGIYLQDLIKSDERFKERMMREQMKSEANQVNDQDGDQVDFSGCGVVVFDHMIRISKQIDELFWFRRKSYDNITIDHILQVRSQ